ncbi:hypothetical protein SAMN05660226_00122 [Parapedobacter luteus]|uniref:Uncharacterized protein n=1 Tax=Parapedobacter luteus TaxID=623280 RepID=A0A1T4ZUP3_9SPHI|nr:hypothetical protein SAMN05660226_00122 [Parapedobacter luteus]
MTLPIRYVILLIVCLRSSSPSTTRCRPQSSAGQASYGDCGKGYEQTTKQALDDW